jgi:hypothetical protein
MQDIVLVLLQRADGPAEKGCRQDERSQEPSPNDRQPLHAAMASNVTIAPPQSAGLSLLGAEAHFETMSDFQLLRAHMRKLESAQQRKKQSEENLQVGIHYGTCTSWTKHGYGFV